MAAPSVRDAFLKDGFVHVRNALDRQTVETALACWTWSTETPGPGSARVFRDSLAHVDDPAAARLLPSAEDGLFYQDISHMGCLHGGEPTRPGQSRRTLALRFIGEQCLFKSRSDPRDPRNGEPFGRARLPQVLPGRCL